MKQKILIFIISFLFTILYFNIAHTAKKKITGEVYKVDKYARAIQCRGKDLSMLDTGQLLYICDENNKLISTVKITRYFTTIIETKLISGDIKKVKHGMIVYSSKSQFAKRKKIKTVKFEKEYDNYWWEVNVYYKAGNKTYTKKSKIVVPKIIELLAKGSDKKVKISDVEIKNLMIKNGDITTIELKSGESAGIEEIDINIRREQIPEFEVKTKLIVKNIKIEDAYKIGLIKRKSGYESVDKTVDTKMRAGKVKTIGGIEFIYIKGGEFLMGSPDSDSDALSREKPQHKVYVSSFWIGKYEITQKQYQSIMGKNPSSFKGDSRPVERVSWNDAEEFCSKFSKKYGVKVRLPYEAEWEYACRAGTTTKYYWGDSMDGNYCWYRANAGKETHPVGQKKPNQWGLYDMSGNVWEWCMDWYDGKYYRSSPLNNPTGPFKRDL